MSIYTFHVREIVCGACAVHIKNAVKKQNNLNIISVDVNVNDKLVTCDIGEPDEANTETTKKQLIDLLVNEALFSEDQIEFKSIERIKADNQQQRAKDIPQHLLEGMIALIASSVMMGFMLADYSFTDEGMIAMTAVGSVLTLFLGREFYRRAWQARYHWNMYTLIALSTLAAIIMTVLHHFMPGLMMSDSALMLIGFTHVSEAMKNWVRHATLDSVNYSDNVKDKQYQCKKKGEENFIWIAANQIQAGDWVIIQPKEAIPVEGKSTDPHGYEIDSEHVDGDITGKLITQDQHYSAGMILQGNIPLKIEATADWAQSSLALNDLSIEKSNTTRAAQLQKETPMEWLIRMFVPLVIVIALGGGALGFTVGGYEMAIKSTLFLLSVACPCVLGVLFSLTMQVGRQKAKQWVSFKQDKDVETASSIKTVAFDFTGTLTERKFEVLQWKSESCSQEHIVPIVAALEKGAQHIIAKGLLSWTQNNDNKKHVDASLTCLLDKDSPTYGVKGQIHDDAYVIGDLSLIKQVLNDDQSISLMEAFFEKNNACKATHAIYVLKNKQFLGCFFMNNSLRQDAQPAIQFLQKMGKKVAVISGGDRGNVLPLTQQLGVADDDVYTECDAAEGGKRSQSKVNIIEDLKKEGPVAMFGDGWNDGPAFAEADLSVLVGNSGSDQAKANARAFLMDPSLSGAVYLFLLAEATERQALFTLKANLLFNVAVLGVFGAAVFYFPELLSPGYGAGLMAIQSGMLFFSTYWYASREQICAPINDGRKYAPLQIA